LKATNTDIAIGKYSIGQTHFFLRDFNFFEDSKYGPTIITLVPLNHRIKFRGDNEYYLQVDVNLGPENFRHELSQKHPTVWVIIT